VDALKKVFLPKEETREMIKGKAKETIEGTKLYIKKFGASKELCVLIDEVGQINQKVTMTWTI
jgi:hypothetical protein